MRSRNGTGVADHLLDRLEEWGVHTIFGYSGDGINGILGALDRAGDRFEFVQPRHEEMAAAFMAAGFAKFAAEDLPGGDSETLGVLWQSAQGWQSITTR